MGDSLEDEVRKQSDYFYFNKEFLIGQLCGVVAGVATAYVMSNDAENSNNYVSLTSMGADFVVFNVAYISCVYRDRRNSFKSTWSFIKYLGRTTEYVSVPAGIVHRVAHLGAMYGFQSAGLSASLAMALAYLPSSAVFLGVANLIGYLKKDLVTGKNDDKYLKPSSSA